jgi:hypothetical protein
MRVRSEAEQLPWPSTGGETLHALLGWTEQGSPAQRSGLLAWA